MIYQVQDSQNNDITLNPITYTIKDGRIIIETASLGQFVLVNNVENKSQIQVMVQILIFRQLSHQIQIILLQRQIIRL